MLGILVACFSFYPPPICLLAVARQPNLTWWDSSGGYHEEDLVECEDAASKIIDDTCTPKPSLPDECDFNDEEQREYQIMAVATSPYPDLAFTHSLQRCASPLTSPLAHNSGDIRMRSGAVLSGVSPLS